MLDFSEELLSHSLRMLNSIPVSESLRFFQKQLKINPPPITRKTINIVFNQAHEEFNILYNFPLACSYYSGSSDYYCLCSTIVLRDLSNGHLVAPQNNRSKLCCIIIEHDSSISEQQLFCRSMVFITL